MDGEVKQNMSENVLILSPTIRIAWEEQMLARVRRLSLMFKITRPRKGPKSEKV